MAMDNITELERYADKYFYDAAHCRQVLKLSELLFDCLSGLHKLNKTHLLSLQQAAVLHDTGLSNGAVRHHKSSEAIIVDDPPPSISSDTLIRVACIARYHRKALPSPSHKMFARLSSAERYVVEKLAAIIRIADGLDYFHDSTVESLHCDVKKDRVIIYLKAHSDCSEGIKQAYKKSDLFTQVFGKSLEIIAK